MAERDQESFKPLLSTVTSVSLWNGDDYSTIRDSEPSDGDRQGSLADIPAELRESTRDAALLAQGHKAAMGRSFSPLAALGLGFRYAGLT